METFCKWQDEVISGFNKPNLLEVDVLNFCQGSAKRYDNSSCVVRVINKQGEAIGILHQTIRNVT